MPRVCGGDPAQGPGRVCGDRRRPVVGGSFLGPLVSRFIRLPILVGALVAALGLGAAGCKQGLNERCQLSDDCQDGLFCMTVFGSTGTADGVCVAGSDGGTDASMEDTPAVDHAMADLPAEMTTDAPTSDAGDGPMSEGGADMASDLDADRRDLPVDAPVDRAADLPADVAADLGADRADLAADGG